MTKMLKTDRWLNAPKGLRKVLADERVSDFSDEREYEHGYWVYLAPGWNWEGVHCVHEYAVREVVREFANIERCEPGCDCGWDRKVEGGDFSAAAL